MRGPVYLTVGLGAALLFASVHGCGGGGDSGKSTGPPQSCSDLGVLSGITTAPTYEAQGLTIDTVDPEDLFCFTLTQSASVRIDLTFTHLQGNLDVELLDDSQSVISWASSLTDNETIADVLAPGDYLIHVFGVARAVNVYDLAIYIFKLDVLEPNDDPASCSAIPLLPYAQLGLTIHDSFDEDWFCFDLPVRGTPWDVTIDILFMHRAGDLDMDLWDNQLDLIMFAVSRSDNEQITATLPPGMYFLRVYGFGGAVNQYDLSLVAQ